ncbi:endonuclease III [Jannaschia sp.]|nr:endonuclease III [Jannaschia sp.]
MFARLRLAHPAVRPPEAKGGATAFRSVVSCMLSAQSLDRNTAAASRALFALADTPEGILALSDERVVDAIRPAGLYNVKARNLRKMCRFLLDELDGAVPQDREGLMALPGVGRKCADIVLHFTFGQAVVAVDTHVHRVCNRIGLASGKTEAQMAASLDARIPDGARMAGHLLLLDHGKQTCRARSPRCDTCTVADLCEAGPIS